MNSYTLRSEIWWSHCGNHLSVDLLSLHAGYEVALNGRLWQSVIMYSGVLLQWQIVPFWILYSSDTHLSLWEELRTTMVSLLISPEKSDPDVNSFKICNSMLYSREFFLWKKNIAQKSKEESPEIYQIKR